MDLVRVVTGARRDERLKTVCSFLALFFLFISYYLIKPYRNSQFLKDFDPRLLSLVYLGTAVVSFAATKLFSHCYARMDKYRLVVWTYAVIIACKLGFTLAMRPESQSPALTILFYFWASVYFLLANAALWACVNDIFTPEQGERCFGFVALGAILGNIAGAGASSLTADHWLLSRYPLVLSAVAMVIALAFILLASRQPHEVLPLVKGEPTGHGFWAEVSSILRSPYVRAIAVMVFCLAFYTTEVELTGQVVIDQRLAEAQYEESFRQLSPDPDGFQLVYSLKSVAQDQRQGRVADFLSRKGLPATQLPQWMETYRQFRDELELKQRSLFGEIYAYQGVLGVFLLVVVSRFLFARLGLGVAVTVLPLFSLVALGALYFPVGLTTLEVLLVIGGALNYSLNNATKELLYTATSADTKFRQKPIIEGPGQRLGDVCASLCNLGITLGLVFPGALGESAGHRLFLTLGLGLVVWWLLSISFAGREYDRLRRQG